MSHLLEGVLDGCTGIAGGWVKMDTGTTVGTADLVAWAATLAANLVPVLSLAARGSDMLRALRLKALAQRVSRGVVRLPSSRHDVAEAVARRLALNMVGDVPPPSPDGLVDRVRAQAERCKRFVLAGLRAPDRDEEAVRRAEAHVAALLQEFASERVDCRLPRDGCTAADVSAIVTVMTVPRTS